MTQIFRIEIDGIDVTDNAENTSISRTINREIFLIHGVF